MSQIVPADIFPFVPAESDPLATVAFRSMFWRPRFEGHSPVLAHIPFLFWLSSLAQPRRVVVLGAGDGHAHFAFCQTLDKLGLSGRCEGFGFWQDETQGKATNRAINGLLAHSSRLYEEISRLSPAADLAAVRAGITDGSVDLLFVDLDALAPGNRFVPDEWTAALADGGILLIYGIDRVEPGTELSEGLAAALQSFSRCEMHEGGGLGVYAMNPPDPLASVFRICQGGALPPFLQIVFRRLGEGLSFPAANQALLMERKLRAADQAALQKLRGAYDERSRRLAEWESRAFDLEQLSSASADEVASLQARLSSLNDDHEALLNESVRLRARVEQQGAQVADLEDRLRAQTEMRFEETQALTELHAELSQDHERLKQSLADQTQKRVAVKQMLAEKRVAYRELTAEMKEKEALLVAQVEVLASQSQEKESLLAERVALMVEIEQQNTRVLELEDRLRVQTEIRFKETQALTKLHAELSQHHEILKKSLADQIQRRAAVKQMLAEKRIAYREMAAQTKEKEALLLAQVEALTTQLQEKEALLSANDRDKTTLAEQLAQAKAALAAARLRLTEYRQRVKSEKKRLVRESEKLAARNAAMMSSTSWRITAPMRKAKQAFSRDRSALVPKP